MCFKITSIYLQNKKYEYNYRALYLIQILFIDFMKKEKQKKCIVPLQNNVYLPNEKIYDELLLLSKQNKTKLTRFVSIFKLNSIQISLFHNNLHKSSINKFHQFNFEPILIQKVLSTFPFTSLN